MIAHWRAGPTALYVEFIKIVPAMFLTCGVFIQAFEAHVKKVYGSSDFKEKAKEAQKFLTEAKDFVFGRSTSFENVHNVRAS